MYNGKTYYHLASILSVVLLLAVFFTACKQNTVIDVADSNSSKIEFVLKGKVIDTQSQPVSDATLTIVAIQKSSEVVSGTDGTFTFTLPEGTPEWVTIKAQKKGLRLVSSQDSGTMMTGQTNTIIWQLPKETRELCVTLVMSVQPVLNGIVNLSDGHAAKGAKVLGVFSDEASKMTEWEAVFADDKGMFQMNVPIESSEVEAYFLVWDKNAQQAAQHDVLLNTKRSDTMEKVYITLSDEVRLEGNLLSSTGDVMSNTALQCYYRSPIGTISLDTTATLLDTRGNFALFAAPDMEIGIRLRDDNRQTISTWLPVNNWMNRKATLIYNNVGNELMIIFDSPAID